MKTKFEQKMYVLIAYGEYDSTIYDGEVVGVFDSQARAFYEMEHYDILKHFESIMNGPIVIDSPTPRRTFMQDEKGRLVYSETTYIKHTNSVLSAGSITLSITEVIN